ncbi:MAG: hypothetical protein V2B19_17455 [Pseudomonadota bacterium]
MSLSKEWQEYHLTPHGWIEGSFKGDFGSSTEVEKPKDCVLTIVCYDERTSIHSEPYFYDRIDWETDDKKLVGQLKRKFGEKPDWFGYKMMKK